MCDKKSNFKDSKHVVFTWRNILIMILTSLLGSVLSSCEKDDSQFYVKYELDSRTIYYGRTLNVEVIDESNNVVTYSVNQRELWEVIIGPVEKGFKANMKVEVTTGPDGYVKLYPSIYVSKDNGPFTLEKSDLSDEFRDEVEVSYKVE